MNRELDLNNPQTYNDKLQWLKLYDHNPLYTTLVDKYSVKKWVSECVGEKYVIPTIGCWNRVNDIDWNALPDQFVLKCTHDSGGLIICKDKSKLDIPGAKRKLRRSLRTDYYLMGFEWPYKGVPRRIIAEPYLEDKETGELRDYKFFCFNGEVKALFIATERFKNAEPYFDFFDTDFNHLDIRQGHPNAPVPPKKPECFDEMKRLAAILSSGLPEARIDFYEVDGKIYFGEVTLFHFCGFTPFSPQSIDELWGGWIQLP